MSVNKNFLWTEKYRPSKVDDCILSDELKEIFKSYIRIKEIPNIILVGPAGTGKTTVALAMLDELDFDYMFVNASKENGIDTLRDKITEFASTMSFKGGRKYIILDEADGMTSNLQDALKGFMEEYSANAGFILTCNNLNKIIAPMQSRCRAIDFNVPKSEYAHLAKNFYDSLLDIILKEGHSFDPQAKAALAQLIKTNFPDWRKMLNFLQSYAVTHGKIDNGILGKKKDVEMSGLIQSIKGKKWTEIRKWVGENYFAAGGFLSFELLLRKELDSLVVPESLPALIMIINDYDERESRVADKELNVMAMLTKIMTEVSFV